MFLVDGAVYTESWASSAEAEEVLWTQNGSSRGPESSAGGVTTLIVDGYVGYEPAEGRWRSHHLPNAAIDRALFGSACPDVRVDLADSGSGSDKARRTPPRPTAFVGRGDRGSPVTHDDYDLESAVKTWSVGDDGIDIEEIASSSVNGRWRPPVALLVDGAQFDGCVWRDLDQNAPGHSQQSPPPRANGPTISESFYGGEPLVSPPTIDAAIPRKADAQRASIGILTTPKNGSKPASPVAFQENSAGHLAAGARPGKPAALVAADYGVSVQSVIMRLRPKATSAWESVAGVKPHMVLRECHCCSACDGSFPVRQGCCRACRRV